MTVNYSVHLHSGTYRDAVTSCNRLKRNVFSSQNAPPTMSLRTPAIHPPPIHPPPPPPTPTTRRHPPSRHQRSTSGRRRAVNRGHHNQWSADYSELGRRPSPSPLPTQFAAESHWIGGGARIQSLIVGVRRIMYQTGAGPKVNGDSRSRFCNRVFPSASAALTDERPLFTNSLCSAARSKKRGWRKSMKRTVHLERNGQASDPASIPMLRDPVSRTISHSSHQRLFNGTRSMEYCLYGVPSLRSTVSTEYRLYGVPSLWSTVSTEYRLYEVPSLRSTVSTEYRLYGVPSLRSTVSTEYRLYGVPSLRSTVASILV